MTGLKFLARCLAVVATVCCLDFLCHPAMDAIRSAALHAQPDNYEMSSYYGVEMATEDVLVLGASTATHHYDPAILADSLHMSVRNLGKDGAFLYCQACQLSLILERYVPKLIIWDISDDCLSHNLDWGDYLEISDYWPYPPNSFSKSIIKEMGPSKQLSLHSWLYRYNSKLPEYLFAFLSGRSSQKGYLPLSSDFSYAAEIVTAKVPENIHPLKAQLLEQALALCKDKGCRVVLFTSPRLTDDGVQETEQYQLLCDITERLGVPYINYHVNPHFFQNTSLFRDADHMNEKGAALFTQCVAEDLLK